MLEVIRMVATSLLLGVLLSFALFHNNVIEAIWPRKKSKVSNQIKDLSSEKAVRSVKYYAEREGYGYEEYRVVTGDGFVLLLQRILPRDSTPRQPGALSHPVVLQHGLCQSSGVFVTNEESSLAFYLVDQGYDVWLGNNRGVLMEHTKHKYFQPQFWDWTVDDLGRYDMPAIVDHVLNTTGHSQLTWIGHSQGNCQAFMALSQNPEMEKKIKLLIALAPTARLGDLPSQPLKLLRQDFMFDYLLGHSQFIPMINYVLVVAPASLFSVMGYNMFYYLFRWSDTKWIKSRKSKYFQFSGMPVSCKQIRHWMKMTEKRMIYDYHTGNPYPIEKISVPIAVFHGEEDEIADANSLEQLLCEDSSVPLRHFEKISGYEHMDMIWAEDCEKVVFPKIHELISSELKRASDPSIPRHEPTFP